MSRLNVRRVFAVSIAITIIAGSLASFLFFAIIQMRNAANSTDDARAMVAAEAASSAIRSKLAVTVKDNSVWDDAYNAINSVAAQEWAYRNWGSVSQHYALYDGVIVQGSGGQEIAAYYKGEAFDPGQFFGEYLEDMYREARSHKERPSMSYVMVKDLLVVVGANSIQSFSKSKAQGSSAVLVFFKIIDDQSLLNIGQEYQLPGLRLFKDLPPASLSLELKDIKGNTAAYLGWPSQKPGDKIYTSILPYLYLSAAWLAAFVLIVIVVSRREVSILRDIASLARHEATHDALTGLLNRRGLLEALEANQSRIRLYLIGLDGFKTVNDTWGHDVGDVLLQRVAKRLSSSHPDISALARLGSDEFALVQTGTSAGVSVASAIARSLSDPHEIEGRIFEMGASVGYAEVTTAISGVELIRRADMALHQAKQQGRGLARAYTAQLDSDREQTAILEQRLREAIKEHQIVPVFQPIVSARTGEIRSVEALARWQTQTGPVTPDVFIPLAERSGMIDRLGMQMLMGSIRAVKDMPGLGLSVNISPIQLCNPEFAGQLKDLLSQERFNAERLTLEITEGVLISNPDQTQSVMQALKAIGIKFALDDFGSGFASIGALRQFCFDRLKVDKSIVRDAHDDMGRGVLKATVGVATALGIPVTAEGVESEQQVELLRKAGCEQLQGIHVGRPMSIDDLRGVLFKSLVANLSTPQLTRWVKP